VACRRTATPCDGMLIAIENMPSAALRVVTACYPAN
jgi:hypothetical protein